LKIFAGNFELIHECSIARYFPSPKIQLNVDGKKILPPVKAPRSFFQIHNFSDLIVHGEKLFKPLKTRFKSEKPPSQIKLQKTPDSNNGEAKTPKKEKKIFKRLKPTKIYRSPQRPRNILKSIIVKPPSSNDITSYVQKLPSTLPWVLQSTNQKFANLNDLVRYLNLKDN
jgi:hypothetical protein